MQCEQNVLIFDLWKQIIRSMILLISDYVTDMPVSPELTAVVSLITKMQALKSLLDQIYSFEVIIKRLIQNICCSYISLMAELSSELRTVL